MIFLTVLGLGFILLYLAYKSRIKYVIKIYDNELDQTNAELRKQVATSIELLDQLEQAQKQTKDYIAFATKFFELAKALYDICEKAEQSVEDDEVINAFKQAKEALHILVTQYEALKLTEGDNVIPGIVVKKEL